MFDKIDAAEALVMLKTTPVDWAFEAATILYNMACTQHEIAACTEPTIPVTVATTATAASPVADSEDGDVTMTEADAVTPASDLPAVSVNGEVRKWYHDREGTSFFGTRYERKLDRQNKRRKGAQFLRPATMGPNRPTAANPVFMPAVAPVTPPASFVNTFTAVNGPATTVSSMPSARSARAKGKARATHATPAVQPVQPVVGYTRSGRKVTSRVFAS